MKTIKLISLELDNFKGRKFKLSAEGRNVDIFGDNETGKTSIKDAFTWVLFGKDSNNSAKFDILPLDKDNNMIPYVDSTVELVLDVDGTTINLKKVLKQKWVKEKGNAEKVFRGTTTVYHVNDVPCKMKDFTLKVQDIMDEKIFKLITDPLYANTELKWQDLRKILVELAGPVTDELILHNNKDLEKLLDVLKNRTLEELQASVKASLSKLKKEKSEKEPRIKESQLNIVEIDDSSIKDLNKEREEINNELLGITNAIELVNKQNTELVNHQKLLNSKVQELSKVKFKIEMSAGTLKREKESELQQKVDNLSTVKRRINDKTDEIETMEKTIKRKDKEIIELRAKYKAISQDTLTITDDFICPTCHRKLPIEDIEKTKTQYQENFIKEKTTKLENINKDGCQIAEEKKKKSEQLEATLKEKEVLLTKADILVKGIEDLKTEISKMQVKVNYDKNPSYSNLIAEIKQLESVTQQPVKVSEDVSNDKIRCNKRIEEIITQIADINASKKKSANAEVRVKELIKEEKELSQKIATLERQEFMIENYTTVQSNLIEERVNKLFKITKFKLFDQQVNGGIAEGCKAVVNGIPYNSNLNSAMKVNAGVDIINVLNKYYGIQAPIIIDNRESTNNLIHTDSQVINLSVSKDRGLVIKQLPTKEEIQELDEIIEKMNTELGDYDTSLDNISSFPREAFDVRTEYGEPSRWSISKSITYEYKNVEFVFTCDEPATEQQEGQDTNPQVYRVKN